MVGNSDAKVILLVIEDLVPNGIEKTRTPNLDVLIRAGAATMQAKTGNRAQITFVKGYAMPPRVRGGNNSSNANPDPILLQEATILFTISSTV